MRGIWRIERWLQCRKEARLLRRAERAVAAFPKITKKQPHGLPGELIISLTSYPARFGTLASTIKSLLDQQIQADRTILWVGLDDLGQLPPGVTQLQTHGLEIRPCEDTRSFKKIIPALEEFPLAYIATADDDLYYPPDWLKLLAGEFKEESPSIVCLRAHIAKILDNGRFAPYAAWELATQALTDRSPTELLFPTGVGGVLYPPNCFSPQVTDQSCFLELCPHADDIWLFWMAEIADTPHRQVPGSYDMVYWPGSQEVGLFLENLYNERNDQQIRAMEQYFGPIASNFSL
jgi:hypothetical protein